MIKAYNKDSEISYALGAFVAIELIKKQPSSLVNVIISSKLKITNELKEILDSVKDKVIVDDKAIDKISNKGNVFIVGVFKKRYVNFGSASHVALVRPSDAGNLGTILRTMLGFGVKHLVIIGDDAVDEYNPKTVRASMGAIFSIDIEKYSTFEEYEKVHSEKKYLFMLGSNNSLLHTSFSQPCALIFGNEGSGLPEELGCKGERVVIRHSKEIDSLNLPQAVGIALYEFSKSLFN